MDLIGFDRYNGMELTDSNFVTSPIFEEIVLSVKSATSNDIDIAYVGYKYNFIKENTLENNLISYTSGTER